MRFRWDNEGEDNEGEELLSDICFASFLKEGKKRQYRESKIDIVSQRRKQNIHITLKRMICLQGKRHC